MLTLALALALALNTCTYILPGTVLVDYVFPIFAPSRSGVCWVVLWMSSGSLSPLYYDHCWPRWDGGNGTFGRTKDTSEFLNRDALALRAVGVAQSIWWGFSPRYYGG